MKKIFVPFYALALMLPLAMFADRPVEPDQLPLAARTFIKEHFADAKISLVTFDDGSYDVDFADRRSVEFNRKGEWKEVDCGRNRLPDGILPEAIVKYIADNYSGNFACDVSRDRRDWEVSLNNGRGLKFDTRFRLIDIDD